MLQSVYRFIRSLLLYRTFMTDILHRLQRGIIVSAQAAHGEPLNRPEYLCALAESALNGGACAVRMAQVENIQYFKERHPTVPVIGITKPEIIPENAHQLVYITPTLHDVETIAPYCDIIAMDATMRPRPDGEKLDEIVAQTRKVYPDRLLMADVANLPEGIRAEKLGFDLISTTLSGYTVESRHTLHHGPDFELLADLVKLVQKPIVLEGRVWHPEEVTRAFEMGAYAVVIGSAVTRPHEITRRFVNAVAASP
jgi:N-acylglucosamine-6-phosphate 2-epimerase